MLRERMDRPGRSASTVLGHSAEPRADQRERSTGEERRVMTDLMRGHACMYGKDKGCDSLAFPFLASIRQA
jgi:hypothetical protein